jgi:hypothetical protein
VKAFLVPVRSERLKKLHKIAASLTKASYGTETLEEQFPNLLFYNCIEKQSFKTSTSNVKVELGQLFYSYQINKRKSAKIATEIQREF